MRIISGTRRGMKLTAPAGLGTRPVADRVKVGVFNILGVSACEGARCLDIFSGVGSFGLETLSRGAAHCGFIETSRDCIKHLNNHLSRGDFTERAKIIKTKAEIAISRLLASGQKYDLIFLDPPFVMAADESFYADGALLSRSIQLLKDDGILMLRRDGKGKHKSDSSFPANANVIDTRNWSRNEVLFIRPIAEDDNSVVGGVVGDVCSDATADIKTEGE